MIFIPAIATDSVTMLPQLWHDPSMRWYLLILFAVMFGLIVIARMLRQAHRGRPSSRQAGTATIEFALVFPIFLFLILTLVQTSLLMVGNLYVHYAAFAAVRSAIVQVPRDIIVDPVVDAFNEPRNRVNGDDSTKRERIRRAAVYALVPVAGRLNTQAAGSDIYTNHLQHYFNTYDRTAPNWVDRLAGMKLQYANAYTDIDLYIARPSADTAPQLQYTLVPRDSTYTFGEREAVTVRVTHRLNLAMPYVGSMFADGKHDANAGTGRYVITEAMYALTNEGIDPYLPLEPTLPRSP